MIRLAPFAFSLLAIVLGTSCVSGWVEEGSSTSAELNAVFGLTGTDVFAVGTSGTVVRRENSKWRTQDTGITTTLRGVWASSPTQVVAVGDYCRALQYSGPPEGEATGPVFQVLTSESCYPYRDIDGAGASSAVVVGERGRIQLYDGGRLRNGSDFPERLLGVSVPAEGEIFAVGEGGVFYHRHNDQWTRREVAICQVELTDGVCPIEPMKPVLWDVWVGPNGEGAAVDSYGNLWRIPEPAETEPWEPFETGYSGELFAVHGYVDGDQTHLYAAGAGGVLLHVVGDKVSWEVPGPHQNLLGVWVDPEGKHVYVVGAKGTIAHLAR